MISFQGIEIYCSPYVEPVSRSFQYKFPRSKKKRIRLKWKKRSENWKSVVEEHFVQMGNKVFVSKKHFEQLKNQISNVNFKTFS